MEHPSDLMPHEIKLLDETKKDAHSRIGDSLFNALIKVQSLELESQEKAAFLVMILTEAIASVLESGPEAIRKNLVSMSNKALTDWTKNEHH